MWAKHLLNFWYDQWYHKTHGWPHPEIKLVPWFGNVICAALDCYPGDPKFVT